MKKKKKNTEKETETAKALSTFFSNSTCNFLANEISDPVLKAIVKYKNHRSILELGEVSKKATTFSFSCVDIGDLGIF